MKRKREEKRVTFAEEALLYLEDRSEEEVKRSWYSPAELAVFKRDRREIVKMLKKYNFNVDLIETSGQCLRGFEPYFSVDVNKHIKITRDLVFKVVLGEQRRQQELGICDNEAISNYSIRASEWARGNAMQQASRDAVESFHYYFYG